MRTIHPNWRSSDAWLAYGLAAALLCASISGCASTRATPPAPTTHSPSATATALPTLAPTPTSGCCSPPPTVAGTSSTIIIPTLPSISYGSITRMFRVHTPVHYRAGQRYPVVVVYHGYGGDARESEKDTGFSPFADQQGIVAVYPQGLDDTNGKPFWASAGPIDLGIDELPFANDMLNTVQSRYCVDPGRVYVTGFSNGGGMANYLACHMAERVAAAVPISGNYYFSANCHPARPISILEVHGVADDVVPYAGDPPKPGLWHLPPVTEWLQGWAKRDGCTTGPETFWRAADVTALRWTNCQGNVTVMHYRMEHGGHAIPATVGGQPFLPLMWQFFLAHPRG